MAVTGNEHGFFWDSNNGDRTYNSESFELWLKKFFTSGVFQDELQVTAGGGMSVAVSAGYANCDGKVKMFSATSLSVDAASATLPRIDTVVVERNDSDRTFYLKVVKGAYNGQSPVATSPVRTGGVYQLVLAQIRVNAGATSISTGNITDKRPDSAVCGWVTGTVDEIDLEQILAQSEAEFTAWFNAMKGQLSTDAAGNLQAEIDDVNASIETLTGTTLPTYLKRRTVSLVTGSTTQANIAFITVTASKTTALQNGQNYWFRDMALPSGYIPLGIIGVTVGDTSGYDDQYIAVSGWAFSGTADAPKLDVAVMNHKPNNASISGGCSISVDVICMPATFLNYVPAV